MPSQTLTSTCCVLVHGIRPFIFIDPRKWMTQSPLRSALDKCLPPMEIVLFHWSAHKNQLARNRAATELGDKLRQLLPEFEKIVVVSHSHGGNIALQAIRSLDDYRQISLVTMGTAFLRVEDAPIEANIRFGAAYLSGALLLAGVLSAWLFGEGTFSSAIWSLGLMLVFAVVVLSSGTWLPVLSKMIGGPLLKRRKQYQDACAPDSLPMLVAYHTGGDEGLSLLRGARSSMRRSSRQARESLAEATRKPVRFPIWPLVFLSLGVICLVVYRTIWAEAIFLSWTIGFCLLAMLSWIVPLLPGVPAQIRGIGSIGKVPFVQAVAAFMVFGAHPIDLLAVRIRATLLPGSAGAGSANVTSVEIPLARERGTIFLMLVRWVGRLRYGWYHSAHYKDASIVAKIVEWVSGPARRAPLA